MLPAVTYDGDLTMKFMLMIYSNESGWAQITPAQQEQGMQAYLAYSEALEKAGAVVASHRLQPVGSATITGGFFAPVTDTCVFTVYSVPPCCTRSPASRPFKIVR